MCEDGTVTGDFLDELPNFYFDTFSQPRPQGFSLKKWVGREKPWGRGWPIPASTVKYSAQQ